MGVAGPGLGRAAVDQALAWALQEQLSAPSAVGQWAEAAANAEGATLRGRGLRLFDGPAQPVARTPCPVNPTAPSDLGHLYERMLAGETRKRGGVHLTPQDVATGLVRSLGNDWVSADATVLDPSVGGGAFLIATAQVLHQSGVQPAKICGQLHGVDLDPVAVAIAECSIGLWGIRHGVEPGPLPNICAGDGLLDDLVTCDVVVGNPPFLNQLRSKSSNMGDRRSALRERWPGLVTTYTDEGWLFLAAAVSAAANGGRVAMVQPVSLLAARHAATIRGQIATQAALAGMWLAAELVFDASVQVCAPVLAVGSSSPTHIRCWKGRDFVEVAPVVNQAVERDTVATQPAPGYPNAEWAQVAASIAQVPKVSLGHRPTSGASPTLGDIAKVTAGFRDQFYGFAPYVSDTEPPTSSGRLATVGMIDPFQFAWGKGRFRFAGNTYEHPWLDLDRLCQENPTLGQWAQDRSRPKVIVATQSRTLEAWADSAGDVVPATPVISIEPVDAADLWRVLALVMAPATTAALFAAKFGTALSLSAIKVAASDLAALRLPVHPQSWDASAELARLAQESNDLAASSELRAETLIRFGAEANRSLGVGGDATTRWWIERIKLS